MKAAVFHEYGGTDKLSIIEVEQPEVREDEVLIKAHAASVNPLDWKILSGQLRFMSGLMRPRISILGFDVSGEVVTVGKNVSGLQVGDAVYSRVTNRGGTFAEYITVPAGIVAKAPKSISMIEAAAVPLASLTALQALRDKAGISKERKVLINGASGGVGTFAVQLAKAYGSNVTAVCSSRNAEMVSSLGADEVLDYEKNDFTANVESYSIIFDAVANRSYSECKPALSSKGVYVTTVPSPGDILSILLTSFTGGKKARVIMVRSSKEDLDWITSMIDSGKVKPVIDKEFPFSEIADALTYSKGGRARGKIVILF
ncbi:MAG: NAD(P)-dependent alcohol dehydrogenase [Nitrospirota bacterium]|nr:MAG: NAD(P)-dependent alcohol dehydrogenase [Nitrospirota bacterium]